MNAISPVTSFVPEVSAPKVASLWDARQLSLVRSTAARTANDDEFNQFVAYARLTGLDPLRRQIHAIIFNADTPSKRQMSIVIGINGYRAMAARTGCYRGDPGEPKVVRKAALKDAKSNPKGLVKATVTVFQFAHGEWFPVTGVANWDEFAPLRGTAPNAYIASDSMWLRMPELMLAKCAEAQALRKAWPDIFANTYEESEVDRAKDSPTLNLLPSEYAEQGKVEGITLRNGGPAIITDWLTDGKLESVPVREYSARVLAFIEEHRKLAPLMIQQFRERNREGLKLFWQHEKGEAHKVRVQFEAIDSMILNAREDRERRARRV